MSGCNWTSSDRTSASTYRLLRTEQQLRSALLLLRASHRLLLGHHRGCPLLSLAQILDGTRTLWICGGQEERHLLLIHLQRHRATCRNKQTNK